MVSVQFTDLATMSAARELKFFLARVADQAERYADVITYLNDIIGQDANLTADERNLLSVAYKALTGSRRSALRTINAFLEDENIKGIPERLAKLTELRTTLVAELDKYCDELITLTDAKLLPAAADASTKVFFHKLKADYYRYSVEFKTADDRKDGSAKADKSYTEATAIAAELGRADPSYLGLALNYSVFLYEIKGEKAEAIDLADKAFKEAVELLDQVDEGQYSEATLILQLLKDNVAL
jgi:14-3-3 protein epsilon